jgi:hypothetical protein
MVLVLLLSFEHLAEFISHAWFYRAREKSPLDCFVNYKLDQIIKLENALPKLQDFGIELLRVDLVVRKIQRQVDAEFLLD